MSSHAPITTALLSYGMSGEVFHAPLLQAHPQFVISTILERSGNRAGVRYPEVKVVKSLDEVLSDEAIELVIVNTPHATHLELTRKALEAGKHVVVEKPFTNTVAEGRELIALAGKVGKVLTVFQNRRWDGDFMTMQKVVQSRVLGRLVEVEAHYDRYRPVVDRQTWKEGSGAGSGILFNLGAHMIDQALVLFGLPDQVDARVDIQREGGLSPDSYDIRMIYDHGMRVILKSSYLVREPGPRYILHGEKGSFVKHGLDPQEQALKEGAIPGSPDWGTEPKVWWGKLNTEISGLHIDGQIETLPGNYLGFYDSVFNAIRNQEEPAVSPQQALDVIRLIELAIQSSKEQRALAVPR